MDVSNECYNVICYDKCSALHIVHDRNFVGVKAASMTTVMVSKIIVMIMMAVESENKNP